MLAWLGDRERFGFAAVADFTCSPLLGTFSLVLFEYPAGVDPPNCFPRAMVPTQAEVSGRAGQTGAPQTSCLLLGVQVLMCVRCDESKSNANKNEGIGT